MRPGSAGPCGNGDAKLVAGVRGQSVLGHQFTGDDMRGRVIYAALAIDPGELFLFAGKVCGQFGPLACQVGLFGIMLRTDRDMFARSHGHGARHQCRQRCNQDAGPRTAGRSDAEDQAGRGKNAVVGASTAARSHPIRSTR
jgi:hypothetical protein